MQNFGGWEKIDPDNPIGEGGQSKVFLVRNPARVKERNECMDEIIAYEPWKPVHKEDVLKGRAEKMANAIMTLARPESPKDLGALKVFKIPEKDPDAEEAINRLVQEIKALQHGRPGILKLLDANVADRWIVTEYYPEGTLADKPERYKGNALAALEAFQPLEHFTNWCSLANLW